MSIKNWSTGEEAILTFKPKSTGSWFGFGSGKTENQAEDLNSGGHIVGKIIDSKGALRFEIKGKWDTELKAYPVSSVKSLFMSKPIMLWKRNEMPLGSKENFEFGLMGLRLNQISPELAKLLPPSDARLRPYDLDS
jgi:hypothetical protein